MNDRRSWSSRVNHDPPPGNIADDPDCAPTGRTLTAPRPGPEDIPPPGEVSECGGILTRVSYRTGPQVAYRVVPTGRTASEVAERLVDPVCPTCGADWRPRGSYRVGYNARREYLCWACMTFHPGVQVDRHGHVVATPGWGLARAVQGQPRR